ncbi:MAG: TonB-dependent receptor [Wenzhouxiangellaceae bacterium]|nr:TonB-dependent receptor [Wenzhouxiangellaceae bacterium]MBS3746112.1 TonB-dependent receptor [Wenzhouxiangellaceae bacterium]MBS3822886.1 TonB-dependent receptor [Wenzhouxiangellaceae bacterium]
MNFLHSHCLAFIVLLLLKSAAISAQSTNPPEPEASDDTVRYPAAFFSTYQPISARDMVRQVPGFQISNGDGSRGFGGAAGNVLINGERPSSKQDPVSAILERIPAARVERIDLIRGNTGRYDAGGQSVIVNVILDTAGRSWNWDATLEQDLDSGSPTPSASVSLIDRAGRTSWGAGISARKSFFGNTIEERLFVQGLPAEDRDEFERTRRHTVQLNANSATTFGGTTLRLNAEVQYQESDFLERSRRTPLAMPEDVFNLNRASDDGELEFEIGGDLEWSLAPAWDAKVIGLHRSEIEDDENRELLIADPLPENLRRKSIRDTTESESIGRFELDWSALEQHLLEFDIETALNSLDNALVLLVDDDGELIPVDVPGANNRVEELRGDVQLRDTWQLGDFSLESALGAEASRISQSGEGTPDQDFFFIKPSLTLIHAPDSSQLNRISLAREIAQLNFGDFVSSTNFSDDDIDRGNPDLKPQQTWAAEVSTERRFGEVGVAKLTAFHDWVTDVQDLLPIGDRFEVPGNIGDGRRWGLEAEGTIPLDAFGMKQARVDLEARWADSSVTDPVTGADRRFSGQRSYALEGELRQDLVDIGWAWGIESDYVDRAVRFELDELDIDDRGVDVEAFIETTRYFGVKMQLTIQNLLNREFLRDRTVFDGPRGSSPVQFREVRDLRRGRSVRLSVSGAF